ncbi:MAG: hypothetical protein R6U37_03570 [Dehalococcoidia bacterium]
MRNSWKWAILVIAILLAGLLVLAACSDDDDEGDSEKVAELQVKITELEAENDDLQSEITELESTIADLEAQIEALKEETPEPSGPTAVYQVTYEEEVTEWTMNVTSEETVEGEDCWVIEATFDEEPFRYAQPSGAPTKVTGVSYAISKDTLDVIQAKAKVDVMGNVLTSTQTNNYGTVDHGQPFSYGDAYSIEQGTVLEPPMYDPYTTPIDIEVTAVEDVTVPAGTFRCYKVELTSQGNPLDTEWYSAEYDMILPVKVERYAQYQALETRELVSYTPMPAKNSDVPDLTGGEEPTATPTPSPSPSPSPSPTPSPTASPTPTVSPTPTSTPGDGETPTIGTSWAYDVSYEYLEDPKRETTNEITWDVDVNEEAKVTVADKEYDCYVISAEFSDQPRRWYNETSMLNTVIPVDLHAASIWRDKSTGGIVQETFTLYVSAVQMTLDAERGYDYTIERPESLSVGDTWAYTTIIDMPDFLVHIETPWTLEVVGTEEVTVPAGNYECFKIAATAEDGTVNYEWWAVDEDFLCPVKYQYNYIFMGSETKELTSYTPAP